MGLGVIFIASCIGVFFLLRYRPHGGRTTHEKSGEVGKEMPRRRGTLFGFRSKNPRKGGWVPAPNVADDDWDDGFDRVRGERLGSIVEMTRSSETDANSAPSQMFGYRRDQDRLVHSSQPSNAARQRGDPSTSSVELISPQSGRDIEHMYTNPFADTDVPRSTSPVHYNESVQSRSPSPNSRPGQHRSSGSTASVGSLSLPAGTKFRESL